MWTRSGPDGVLESWSGSLLPFQVSTECRHWEAILPDRPDVIIEDLSVFRGCVVLWEQHRGLPGFSILPLDATPLKVLPTTAQHAGFSSAHWSEQRHTNGTLLQLQSIC